MKIVAYVPLVDEGTQTLVAASVAPVPALPVGNLAVPTSVRRGLTGQTRPAIILSTTEANGVQFANLVVFTDFGDPFRGATPDASVRIARVPFSAKKEPGTFHGADPVMMGASQPGKKEVAAVKFPPVPEGFDIDAATLPVLIEHAAAASIDLKGAKLKEPVLAVVQAHYGLGVK